MEAKDYLKSKKIWLGTKVADMNAPENYFKLEHLLEDYHQAKLKLLDIPAVVGRSEQLKCDKCGTNFIPHLIKPLTICDKCADSFAL